VNNSIHQNGSKFLEITAAHRLIRWERPRKIFVKIFVNSKFIRSHVGIFIIFYESPRQIHAQRLLQFALSHDGQLGRGETINKILKFSWYIFYHIFFRAYLALKTTAAWVQKRLFSITPKIGYSIIENNITPKCAVVAIYPEGSAAYIESLKNLVNGLEDSGYSILVVCNAEPNQEVTQILSSASVFVRPNFGRDFAAYQAGLYYIKQKFGENFLNDLIICNDTLYWFDNSKNIIAQLQQEEWACLYFNLEMHSHAQSFLLRFDEKLVQSDAFNNFWADYLPVNSKRHLIHKGEIGLTTTLLNAGFISYPIVNAKLFDDLNLEVSDDDFEFLLSIPLGGMKPAGAVPIKPMFLNEDTFYSANQYNSNCFSKQQMEENLSHSKYLDWNKNFVFSDPPHRIGLQLTFLLKFPLKRDIFKFQALGVISSVVAEVSPNFYQSIMSDQLKYMQRYMRGDFKSRMKRKLGEF
jgi:hypothetical protein